MTPEDINRVRLGFAVAAREAEAFAGRFYARLFEIDPALRRLFPDDLAGQRAKLAQALAVLVGSLDRMDAVAPGLARLGAAHAGYGVEPRHFDAVGAALIDTLADTLGGAFDAPARAAWATLYGIVADAMKAAMRLEVAA